jgi:hypothetical protein
LISGHIPGPFRRPFPAATTWGSGFGVLHSGFVPPRGRGVSLVPALVIVGGTAERMLLIPRKVPALVVRFCQLARASSPVPFLAMVVGECAKWMSLIPRDIPALAVQFFVQRRGGRQLSTSTPSFAIFPFRRFRRFALPPLLPAPLRRGCWHWSSPNTSPPVLHSL